MKVEELYQDLLQLVSPWQVKRVVADATSGKVLVYLEQAETTAAKCPLCGRKCAVCGKTEERSWRHLNTCQRQTQLFARLGLVDCPEHSEQLAAFPLAEADAPVTFAFAQWVRQLGKVVKNVTRLAAVIRLDDELVKRILSSPRDSSPEEKRFAGGSRDKVAAGVVPEPPRQLGLFAQNDMILINQGLRALRMLQPEQALEYFRKHRQAYPNGPEVASKIALAEFLLQGMAEAPPDVSARIPYRCRFWKSFEEFAQPLGMKSSDSLIADLRNVYFESIIREFEREVGPDVPILMEGIPSGYLYLRAGRIDRAIKHLQALIVQAPDHAALYGYLADAYWLRGDAKIARQCYREACLIDPAAISWQDLRDNELKDLLHDLQLLYNFDEVLAAAWLPSHARVAGIFERKVVGLDDGLEELVNDYLARQKALAGQSDPVKAAELFFRGMILCENEESLRFAKKVDPIKVRRLMKLINPDLFAEFLARVVAAR